MKKGTKRSLMIWSIGILAEIIYALILVMVSKLFDITIGSMFYYISSSLILSVCLYFDKFHVWNKEVKNEEISERN